MDCGTVHSFGTSKGLFLITMNVKLLRVVNSAVG